jgi:hypothetical protein
MASTSTPSSSAFTRTLLGQGFHLCIRFFQGVYNIGFYVTFILPEREASKRRAVPGGLQTFRGSRLLAVMFVHVSQGCEFAS